MSQDHRTPLERENDRVDTLIEDAIGELEKPLRRLLFSDPKRMIQGIQHSTPNDLIGKRVKNYIYGSDDIGWEGFSLSDRIAIGRLFWDMAIYFEVENQHEIEDGITDKDQIFRDAVVAEYTTGVGLGERYSANDLDKLNEAIRDSIDIDNLREMVRILEIPGFENL
jgi:hypothetical protein